MTTSAALRASSVGEEEQHVVGASFTIPVEVLSLGRALREMGDEWQALEQAITSPTLFQSVAWARVVHEWQSDKEGDQSSSESIVLVARDDMQRLIGLWPLQLERHMGVSFAVGLGDPFNQYNDILVHPDADSLAVFSAFIEFLKSMRNVGGLILRKVRQDARCHDKLAELGSPLAAAAAPCVNLSAFDGFSSYHQTIKSKTRKNLRNARNRLTRNGGEVCHVVYDEPDEIAEVAQRAFQLRAAWLDREGISSRAFLDAGFARFVEEICRHNGTAVPGNGNLNLIAFELRQGDKMISVQWGFIHKRYYYAFIAVRNPEFDAQSPGRLHLEDVIRSCAERPIEVVDFLAPDVDYKRTWATDTISIHDYGVGFSARGRYTLELAFGSPRNFAKQIFGALPKGVRLAAIRMMAGRKSNS